MPRRPDPFAIKEAGGDIRDRNVDGFSHRQIEGTTLGEPGLATLRRVISSRVPSILAASVALSMFVIGGRLIFLQVARGEYYRTVAEGNRIRLTVVQAQRGEISDRNGATIATNTPSFNIEVLPADLPRDETERQTVLNDVLGSVPTELLDQDQVQSLSQFSYLPRVVAKGLSRELALSLMVKTSQMRGFSIVAVGEREYKDDATTGQLLGYVGNLSPKEYEQFQGAYQLTDSVGKTGIEFDYESTLRGKPGRRQVEVDALGRERTVYASEPPISGGKLELTIDLRLQKLIYQSLNRAAGRQGGSAVVINPKNGEVLALVSAPGYDANLFTINRNSELLTGLLQDERRPLFNRAIAGQYPPGSTIKPFIAAAALNEKVITPQTTVLSTGGIQTGDQFFADWKAGGHGVVDVYRAIANSVNTFFYIVGGGTDSRPGLGISRITKYLEMFGFGRVTKIDLPGEETGFVPSPAWKQSTLKDRWYRGDTYNVSIGQGNLTVTPLQLAVGYSAMVNNGVAITPHLVKAVRLPNGEINTTELTKDYEVKLDNDVLGVVRTSMRQTITSGSAQSLNSLPIAVAGKTGTAQTATNRPNHAWFAGYAPANDPEIVVVVMVEYGGEGSAVAVPIAREIFNWYALNPLPSQP